jgi:tRNA1Val (adenine37-N6)-methyltransferase
LAWATPAARHRAARAQPLTAAVAVDGAGLSDDELTEDSLLRGRVRLVQPRRGFRSSLDPVLLAGFLAPPYGRVLDLGAGTGALGFLLLARDPSAIGVAVEVQPRLARCVRLGIDRNGWADRWVVQEADARVGAWGKFDLVATNPPFQPVGTGVLPPDEERAIAHHEVRLRLDEWVAVAAGSLAAQGRVGVVFPAERADPLRDALAAAGLGAQRVREVLPEAGRPPRRVLVEATRGQGAVMESPLVVHEGGGYSREVREMLGE